MKHWNDVARCLALLGLLVLSSACSDSEGQDPVEPGQDVTTGPDSPNPPSPDSDDSTSDGESVEPADAVHSDVTATDEGPALDGDPTADDTAEEVPEPYFKQLKTGLSNEFVFKGVWVGDNTVTAVGNDGVIVRKDELNKWKVAEDSEETELLNAIHGSDSSLLWIVGKDGTILRGGGDTFGPPTECVTDLDCEDADPCTTNFCVEGACGAEGTGAPNCCGTAPLQEGWFQPSLGTWTASEETGGASWQVLSYTDPATELPRYSSEPYALHFGVVGANPPTYDTGQPVSGTVTSADIKLPATGTAELSFQLFMDTEATATYDQLIVEVQQPDSGVVWEVWSKQMLGGQVPNVILFPQVANLDQWVGQTIRIRFRFDSVDASANTGEGVFIDDIVIQTACAGLSDGDNKFSTLWGTHSLSHDEGYAVGRDGTIVRYNGQSWQQVMGPGSGQINWRGMTGFGSDFVMVGTSGGLLVGQAGRSEYAERPTLNDLTDVATVDGSVYWAVGLAGTIIEGAGDNWSLVSAPTVANLWGVAAQANDNVWAVGDEGTILHYDGITWTSIASGTTSDLKAVYVAPSGTVSVSGANGTTLQGGTAGFTLVAPLSPNYALNAAHGFGESPVFVVGEGGHAFRYTGAWQQDLPPVAANLRDVWGSAPDDVWAVGYAGVILHWDGSTWTQVPSGFSGALETVWGTGPDDVYAAGSVGTVMHWDGTAWTSISDFTTENLRAVFGLSSTEVWAVGGAGTILHFNGFGWQKQAIELVEDEEVTDQLNGVWAASPDRAWAVGSNGQIVHWNGKVWRSEELDYGVTLRAVWGTSDYDVFAVGNEGLILHWDGVEWSVWPSGSIATLYAIHGDSHDNVFISGDIGTIMQLMDRDDPPVAPEDPNASDPEPEADATDNSSSDASP